MKVGFGQYLRAAFNAKPMGMFVPPNWVMLALFGFLGFIEPGLWAIGGGLEMAYLYLLSMNPRFQRTVVGSQMLETRQEQVSKQRGFIAQLNPDDQELYFNLERRCQAILRQQGATSSVTTELQSQGEGLGRLLWIFLRLLLTRQSIQRVLMDAQSNNRISLEKRLAQVQQQLTDKTLADDLRKSLTSQTEILQQRIQSQQEAKQKLQFIDAELTRIQEQAELIREQVALSTDPASISQRIDSIAATLGGTTQWIKEQQQMYGSVEDLLAEPPPVIAPPAHEMAAKENQ
jgi:hypothetical protein